jgi:hypothetical protein
MAAQLIAAGQDVSLLALLDTRVHLAGAPPLMATEEDLIGLFLRDHGLDLGGPQGPGRVARALADGRRRGVIPPSLSLGEFVNLAIRYGQAFMENVSLARAYTPTSRVPRLIAIEAADRPLARAGAAQDWTLWADHVMQEQVPGDHFSILRPPHVDAVARIVARHLRSGSVRVSGPPCGSQGARDIPDERDLPRAAQAVPHSRRNIR